MLDLENIDALAKKLYVYDVEQGAWEQEPNGLTPNMGHVLTHLTKDLTTKDFNDPEVSRTAIAPDCLQYAIRLSRWTMTPIQLFFPSSERRSVPVIAERLGGTSLHFAAIAEAAALLARNIHDLDHAKDREKASVNRGTVARLAGRMLVFSAEKQARTFDFDLIEAFDARLVELRHRFHIPEPST